MLISAVTELNWDKKNRIKKPTILCVCIYIIYMYLLDVMSLVIFTYLLTYWVDVFDLWVRSYGHDVDNDDSAADLCQI